MGSGPPTLGTYQSGPTRPAVFYLQANQYSVVTPFINLLSHYCFRRVEDKCRIGMIIHVLYNFSKPAVTAVSYSIRVGKFSNSLVPIPDWIDHGAGRFTPIHTSVEAVRSPLGPHQPEWRQNLLCKHSTLNVFCCSNDKDMLINRYNWIATPKNSLFLLDTKINT